MRIRNLFIGILASLALVGSSAVAASADSFTFPDPTTPGGGHLSLTTEEYSMGTIYAKANYSTSIFPGVTIDITAKDVATGAVVSTSHIDSATWVYERVLHNFKLGHTYSLQATLAWKDGSEPSITSAPVRQRIVFTDQLKNMTFETINQDVPLNQLNGTVYHAKIRYSQKDDPRAFGQPTEPKVKVAKAPRRSRTVTWAKAHVGSGFDLKNYRVVITKNNKQVFAKNISLRGTRKVVLKNVKADGFYVVDVRTYNIAGNYSTSEKYFFGS